MDLSLQESKVGADPSGNPKKHPYRRPWQTHIKPSQPSSAFPPHYHHKTGQQGIKGIPRGRGSQKARSQADDTSESNGFLNLAPGCRVLMR